MTDAPFTLQNLVTVATYNFPWEAQVAKARLAAFGIPALIAGEHTIRMVALTYAFGGIHVQVSENEAEAARDLLAQPAPLPEIYLVPENPLAELESPEALAAAEMSPSEVVTVARFHSEWEAHLARTLLESEDIAATVVADRLPAVSLLSGTAVARNRLEVNAADAERAAALLQSRADDTGDDEEELAD